MTSPDPLLIAHRAGNALETLAVAEAGGADVVEADLNLWRGRLELRHFRSVGPLPLYWDRWALAPPWRRFGDLAELLEAALPATVLMLDLKGADRRAARLLAATLDRLPPRPRTYVCARAWPLLGEIDPRRAVRIGSAARPDQLARLTAAAPGLPLDGASLHLRLLERERLEALRPHAPLLMSWPVNSEAEAERARALGVTGLISDSPALIAELRGQRERG